MGVYPDGFIKSFEQCPLLNEYGRTMATYKGEGENHGKIMIYKPEIEDANGIVEKVNLTKEGPFMMNVCKLCELDPFHNPSIEMMDVFVKTTGKQLRTIVTLINGPEDFSIEPFGQNE